MNRTDEVVALRGQYVVDLTDTQARALVWFAGSLHRARVAPQDGLDTVMRVAEQVADQLRCVNCGQRAMYASAYCRTCAVVEYDDDYGRPEWAR